MTMREDAGRRMDQMYRSQRHIYDVTRKHYLLGRTTLINGLLPPEGGSVLEIGCGTGWNLIQAAQACKTLKLYGMDVSKVMLDTAHARIAKAGLADRVTLAIGDATAFSGMDLFGQRAFDRVFASYVLSMIPDWRLALQRAAGHLAPGGSLHVVDFGSAQGLPVLLRTGLHAWLQRFDVSPRDTLEAEVKRLAHSERLTPFHIELYRGYAQYAVLSRW
jgi:S-adenosylmethionine-diacylgycerolhomoserine-N-methlytransferase